MTDWAALREPFPDDEIKQRPGRGGLSFSYVDARAVQQRLDDVVTPEGWDFTWSLEPGDVVHGKLIIGANIREDAGYPNSDSDEEPVKSAVSDALKRCAVQFGIGRHLYERGPARQERPVAPAPVQRPRVVPDEEEANPFDDPASTAPIVRPEPLRCPHHPNREPRQNSRGYFCSGRDCPCANDKGYCTWAA